MDKQTQENFFQLLKHTYETTLNRNDISLEELMTTLKDELVVLFAETNKGPDRL
ncbi:hypothetical protein [Peribacillus cavernae]|uniref:hypothetical protein n=1 Tax=Peribacillus cavernae TaxID=1674310 RepID=UPI00163C85A1|nr:hypothetical protein [Peribacillus cavernae]MDQ0220018.1 hypothetical protein [Peribacillus cavernae]